VEVIFVDMLMFRLT